MNKIKAELQALIAKSKVLLDKALSYIPERIPTGVSAHEAWAADIIGLTGLPDNDSMRFALASMVPHAPAHLGFVSKHYFVVRLIKAAANQVAGGVMMDLKDKQAAQIAAAQAAAAAQPVEVTTSTTETASTNGPSQQ